MNQDLKPKPESEDISIIDETVEDQADREASSDE
jgi:hypothetical protein